MLSIPVEELADRLEPLFNDRGIGRDATAFEPRMKPFPKPTAWQATADKALEEDGAAEAELASSRATLVRCIAFSPLLSHPCLNPVSSPLQASRVRTIPTKASLAGEQQQRFADLSSNERFSADKNESAASGVAKTLRYDGEYIHALLVRHGRAEVGCMLLSTVSSPFCELIRGPNVGAAAGRRARERLAGQGERRLALGGDCGGCDPIGPGGLRAEATSRP